MNRNRAAFAAAILVIFALAFLPRQTVGNAANLKSQSESSPSSSTEQYVSGIKDSLLYESSDLEEMGKALTGPDLAAESTLDRAAVKGAGELDDALAFLTIYDKMQCAPDRDTAKAALKNRLPIYSSQLNQQITDVTALLAQQPIFDTQQAGSRVRDDLRAAKSKLDEIAASLN